MSVPYPIDQATAQSILGDPAASTDQLIATAYHHPALRPAVAAHPGMTPELLTWLESFGDPAASAAVALRRAQSQGQVAGPTVAPASGGTPLQPPVDAASQPTPASGITQPAAADDTVPPAVPATRADAGSAARRSRSRKRGKGLRITLLVVAVVVLAAAVVAALFWIGVLGGDGSNQSPNTPRAKATELSADEKAAEEYYALRESMAQATPDEFYSSQFTREQRILFAMDRLANPWVPTDDRTGCDNAESWPYSDDAFNPIQIAAKDNSPEQIWGQYVFKYEASYTVCAQVPDSADPEATKATVHVSESLKMLAGILYYGNVDEGTIAGGDYFELQRQALEITAANRSLFDHGTHNDRFVQADDPDFPGELLSDTDTAGNPIEYVDLPISTGTAYRFHWVEVPGLSVVSQDNGGQPITGTWMLASTWQ
ncbi:MAG: hypothetical protein FWD29_05630 [Micrococcales bacterium]|nr:hypothetical protein [Micrococcales bacterium]